MIVAISAIGLLWAVGTPIDLARQIEAQSTLQNDADAAALAGATLLGATTTTTDATILAQNFMTASTAQMVATVSSPTVAFGTSVSNITVSAFATIPTAFLAWKSLTLPVSATSVVGGPGAPRACVTPAASGAADLNKLYVYGINGTTNATDPNVSHSELADNNNTTYVAGTPYCQTVALPIGDRLAFELDNTTGGRTPTHYTASTAKNAFGYHANIYGATAGTVNIFMTRDYPSSLNTDSTSTAACGSTGPNYTAACQEALANVSKTKVQFPATGTAIVNNTTAATTVYTANSATLSVKPFGGSTTTVTTPTACYVANGALVTATYNSSKNAITLSQPAQQENVIVYNNITKSVGCGNNIIDSPFNLDATCEELNGATLTVDWNDTGDTYDSAVNGTYASLNYVDMSYTYSCTGAAGSITTPFSRVILIQ